MSKELRRSLAWPGGCYLVCPLYEAALLAFSQLYECAGGRADDVFVTAADDIAGMSANQLGPRLGIRNSKEFTVFEFSTPRSGLASPINRANPGFVGFGRTSGGAREFVIPNGPIPANAIRRIVRQ